MGKYLPSRFIWGISGAQHVCDCIKKKLAINRSPFFLVWFSWGDGFGVDFISFSHMEIIFLIYIYFFNDSYFLFVIAFGLFMQGFEFQQSKWTTSRISLQFESTHLLVVVPASLVLSCASKRYSFALWSMYCLSFLSGSLEIISWLVVYLHRKVHLFSICKYIQHIYVCNH